MVFALETVRLRTVAFLLEYCAGDAKARILLEFILEEIKISLIKRNISIEVADDVVLKALELLEAGIKSAHFRRKMPLTAHRKVNQFYPRMIFEIRLNNGGGSIS